MTKYYLTLRDKNSGFRDFAFNQNNEGDQDWVNMHFGPFEVGPDAEFKRLEDLRASVAGGKTTLTRTLRGTTKPTEFALTDDGDWFGVGDNG